MHCLLHKFVYVLLFVTVNVCRNKYKTEQEQEAAQTLKGAESLVQIKVLRKVKEIESTHPSCDLTVLKRNENVSEFSNRSLRGVV